MNDIYCQICNANFSSKQKLSKHINYVHNLTGKEYYDLYIKKENEDKCLVCSNPTKYSAGSGYKPTCSHKCGAIYHRKRLRNDIEKFAQFKQKVSIHRREWNTNLPESERQKIVERVKKTNSNKISQMTVEERKRRFGHLNKLSATKREEFIKEKMLTNGAHKWWKEASEEQKQDVFDRRRKTFIKRYGLIDRKDIYLFEDYKKYVEEVRFLSEKIYKKYKDEINPNNYRRGRGKKYYQLDHKFSISEGFKQKINPEILAIKENLQIIPALENGAKNYKCSITKEELIVMYETYFK